MWTGVAEQSLALPVDHRGPALLALAEDQWFDRKSARIGSVVVDRFGVNGVDGLWVVDASVMPTAARANTMAPILVLAEFAVDDVIGRPRVARLQRLSFPG
jgi:hypothetical protein